MGSGRSLRDLSISNWKSSQFQPDLMAISSLLFWRRMFAIAASLVFLLTSGCAPSNSSRANSNATVITMWHGINPPSNRDVFNELVDRFNQTHEDVHLDAFYIGQPDGQLPKILTAVVGEVPPDLLWFVPQLTGQLVELDAIRSLDDWLDNSPLKPAIDPVLFESMQLDGQIWSIPFATNNAAIFYRPSLFAEAGIEKLPETWEELRAAARKLSVDRDGDGRRDRHGLFLSLGKGEWTVFAWLPFAYSAGGELLGENGQPNLVNSGAIAALDFGAQLVAEDLAILSAPERGYELDNFLNGRVGMQVTGPWTLGFLDETGVDYGVFPFPAKEKPAAVVGGENLFVFKTAPERERAALIFLEYVLSEEFQTEWALRTGYLPINLLARQSPAYQAFLRENPVLNVFLEQMQWARSRPIIPGYTRLSENFGRAIEASLLGEEPPRSALERSQKRLELVRDWQ